MIYNIRGTSGSGKTTLVRRFVRKHKDKELIYMWYEGKPRILGYKLLGNSQPLMVLGRYDDAIKGGGVDNITSILTKGYEHRGGEGNSMDAVEEQIRNWHDQGHHVLFEGLIVTSVWGRWMELAQKIPMHFMFLDTPMETCYQRVLERSGGRTPKGWNDGKSDLQNKHKTSEKQLASITRRNGEVKRQQSSLEDFYKRQTKRHIPYADKHELRYTLLKHKRAYSQLLKILTEEIGWPEVKRKKKVTS